MTESLGQLWINLGVKSTVKSDLAGVGSQISSINNVSSSVTSGLKTLGVAAVAAGAAVGAGLVYEGTKAVGMFQTFEKAVSNAASVTGKTGEAFEQAKKNISAVAQELGQATAFSSSQAADAMYNLASAGYDVSVMSAQDLTPMLNLAAATQYDLAETTRTTASTLSQFGLGFDSAGRVADVFTKVIGSSQANMEKLSYSMTQVGTVASSVGMNIEDTSAALGVLYNAGMDGSTAGTSLKGVIASLISPTDKAVGVLKNMGLTIDDVNPSTKGFANVIQTLRDHGLDATLAFQLFGREGAPAIKALTDKSTDLKALTATLQEAGGTAQTVADQQLDTLAGSLDSLSGSIENMMINIGQALAPTIRQIADSLVPVIPTIQDFVIGIVNIFVNFVSKLGSSVSSIQTIGSTILDVFGNIFKAIAGSGSSVASSAADVVNGIMKRIAGIVIDIAPTIQNGIIGIIGFFKNLISDLQPTSISLSSIATRIITLFRELFSGISGPDSKTAASTLANVINTISAILARFVVVATTEVYKILPTLKSIFSSIITTIKSYIPTLKSVWDSIVTIFNELKPKLEEVINKLPSVWNSLKNSFESVKNVVKNFVNELAPSWDNLKSSFDSVKKIVSEFTPIFTNFLKSFSGPDANTAITIGSVLAGVINIITGAIAGILKFAADHPTLTKFVAVVAALATGLAVLPAIVAAVSAGLTAIGVAIGTALGGIIASVTGFGSAVAAGLALITSPIGLVIGAVALLYVAWKQNWFGIQDTAKTVWSWLKTSVNNVVTDFQTAYAKIISQGDTLKQQFSNAWNSIVNLFSSIKASLVVAVSNLASALSSSYNTIVSGALGLLNNWRTHWNNFLAVVSSSASSVGSQLGALYNIIKSNFDKVVAAASSILASWKTHWDNFKSTLNTASSNISSTLQTLYNNLQSRFNSIKTALAAIVTAWVAKWNEWNSKTSSLGLTTQKYVLFVADKIKAFAGNFSNAVLAIRNAVVERWTAFNTKISDLGYTTQKYILFVADKIKAFAGNFYNAGTAMLTGLYDSLKKGFDKAISLAKDKLADLKSYLPSSPAEKGPFHILPNWDSVFINPISESISKISAKAGYFASKLASIKSPIDSLTSQKTVTDMASVASTSTTNNRYNGDSISISIGAVNNQADIDYLLKQLEARTKSKGLQRGVLR